MISAVKQRWGTKEQELSDEAVVVIKPGADEDTVTYLRIKLEFQVFYKFNEFILCAWHTQQLVDGMRSCP